MAATRILAVNVPRFLGGVMSSIVARQPGLDIVGAMAAEDLLMAIPRVRPDVIVFGSEAGSADASLALLKEIHPRLRVVVIDAAGRSATMHEPGAAAREVREVSPDNLVQMLRGTLRH